MIRISVVLLVLTTIISVLACARSQAVCNWTPPWGGSTSVLNSPNPVFSSTECCNKYGAAQFAMNYCMSHVGAWNMNNMAFKPKQPTYDSIVTDAMTDDEAKQALINGNVNYYGPWLCRQYFYVDSIHGQSKPYNSIGECMQDVFVNHNNCPKDGCTTAAVETVTNKMDFFCNSDGTPKVAEFKAVLDHGYVLSYTYDALANYTALTHRKGMHAPKCIKKVTNDMLSQCVLAIFVNTPSNDADCVDGISRLNENFKRMVHCAGNIIMPIDQDGLTKDDLQQCHVFSKAFMLYTIMGFDQPKYGSIKKSDINPTLTPRAIKRRTLACYGDPHCLIYDSVTKSAEFYTLKMNGPRKWLSNDIVTLEITNEHVDGNSCITIMTGITIYLRAPDGEIIGEYTATGGNAPGAFSGPSGTKGRVESTVDGVTCSITATQTSVANINYVKIECVELGFFAAIATRQGSITLLLVRMAEEVYDVSDGVFVNYPPPEAEVCHRWSTGRRKRQVSTCEAACADKGEYSTGCETDCDTMGEAYALDASSTMEQVSEEAVTQDKVLADPDQKSSTTVDPITLQYARDASSTIDQVSQEAVTQGEVLTEPDPKTSTTVVPNGNGRVNGAAAVSATFAICFGLLYCMYNMIMML